MAPPTARVRRGSKMDGGKAKVTLSISAELISFADAKAARLQRNRSQVVEELLAQDRAREEDELAAEGYRFFNSESVEFAQISLPAVSEALGSDE
jgi:hypothetical protein